MGDRHLSRITIFKDSPKSQFLVLVPCFKGGGTHGRNLQIRTPVFYFLYIHRFRAYGLTESRKKHFARGRESIPNPCCLVSTPVRGFKHSCATSINSCRSPVVLIVVIVVLALASPSSTLARSMRTGSSWSWCHF